MSFSFLPEAEEEFSQAVEYYQGIEPGLGHDFALEVLSAIRRALEFPGAWAILDGEVRRSLVKRFPYGVLYTEEPDGILIVAVMNLHREPGYWKNRKQDTD